VYLCNADMIRELFPREYDPYHQGMVLYGTGEGVLLLTEAFDQQVGVVLDKAGARDFETGVVSVYSREVHFSDAVLAG
jgi:hypothetical protein